MSGFYMVNLDVVNIGNGEKTIEEVIERASNEDSAKEKALQYMAMTELGVEVIGVKSIKYLGSKL